jgi:hypothetical protein
MSRARARVTAASFLPGGWACACLRLLACFCLRCTCAQLLTRVPSAVCRRDIRSNCAECPEGPAHEEDKDPHSARRCWKRRACLENSAMFTRVSLRKYARRRFSGKQCDVGSSQLLVWKTVPWWVGGGCEVLGCCPNTLKHKAQSTKHKAQCWPSSLIYYCIYNSI